MTSMKVLVVGNGAREHAIAWKLASSRRNPDILAAPGNAGTASLGTNHDVDAEDIDGLVGLALEESVDLTIVGPEAPLDAGIVDRFEQHGLKAFGPSRAAARIESSKAFAKQVMSTAGVPTGSARVFRDIESAMIHLATSEPPFVVKADGLAAGKGVIMAPTTCDAERALDSLFVERTVGKAGDTVLIEEWLEGTELSVFAFVDREYVSPMTAACDYKRAFDGDQGPNTGGMGSYSPPRFWDRELEAVVRDTIMEPVAAQMVEMGSPYRGLLYAGLMLTADGPKVLEFNCRLGDPETQVVLPRLRTDFLEVAVSTVNGCLSDQCVEWSDSPWVGVVLASEGYPGGYEVGEEVSGLPVESDDVVVFHAGTRLCESNGQPVVKTSGGRVLTATATGNTMADARRQAYDTACEIKFRNVFFRRDIAANA